MGLLASAAFFFLIYLLLLFFSLSFLELTYFQKRNELILTELPPLKEYTLPLQHMKNCFGHKRCYPCESSSLKSTAETNTAVFVSAVDLRELDSYGGYCSIFTRVTSFVAYSLLFKFNLKKGLFYKGRNCPLWTKEPNSFLLE